jgi:hypothetical protein
MLPDLLHDRLDPVARAAVESHLRGCAECRSELDLLRDLRATMRHSPTLDLPAIVAAVPAYNTPTKRSWVGWRTAAAITFVAAGASSVAVWQRGVPSREDTAAVYRIAAAVVDSPLVSAPAEHAPAAPGTHAVKTADPIPTPQRAAANPSPSRVSPGARELAMAGGSLTDLSDRELASLLKDIESLDAVPSTEVDAQSVAPLSPRRGTP